jgi:hypothetical protein
VTSSKVHVPSNLPSAFALGTAATAEATQMLAKMKARGQWLFMGYLVFAFSRFRPVATLYEGKGKLRKPIFLPDVISTSTFPQRRLSTIAHSESAVGKAGWG